MIALESPNGSLSTSQDRFDIPDCNSDLGLAERPLTEIHDNKD